MAIIRVFNDSNRKVSSQRYYDREAVMHKFFKAGGRFQLAWLVTCVVTALCVIASMSFSPLPSRAEESPAPTTRFGIESLDLQPIRYYAFAKSDKVNYGSDYYKYGAGMNLTWALPPEVKANDYFTLKLPREISVDNAPSTDKVFFTVKDAANPEQVVMNVYFDHRDGDRDVLKFVATPYAEQKAGGTKAFKGTAVIGSEIPVDTIKSIWDLDEALAHPGDYNTPRTTIDKTKKYYQGFRPNYEFFNDAPVDGDPCNHRKTLTYETQYMDGPTFTIDDETSVSYKSQLFYDGYRYTRFGDFMLQPIREDADSITFMILYNVAGTGQAAGKVTKEFSLNNTGFRAEGGHNQMPANLTPYNGSYTNSMEMWKAPAGQGTPFPKDRTAVSPSELKEQVRGDNAALRLKAAKFTFPDDDNTYVIKLKMRKHDNTIDTPSGQKGWFMAAFQSRSVRKFVIEDFYHGTTGNGNAVLEDTPATEFAQTPLSIRKVDDTGTVIKSGEVRFLLQDKHTQYSVTKTLNAEGEVVFNGLFLGHQYQLMEVEGATGYVQQPEPFHLTVAQDGTITFDAPGDTIKARTDLASEKNAYSFDFVNPREVVEQLGYFKVVHKYYNTMTDLDNQANEVHTIDIPETSGSATQKYGSSSPQSYQDYRLVRVERSNDGAIKLGEDGQSTQEGNYVPGEHLQVTYRYVKPGTFNEVHLYFDSQEKAEVGDAEQATLREDNPRTSGASQTGLAEETFTSAKNDKSDYTLLKATGDQGDVQPRQDGTQVSGHFIPGATITHTYYYYRTSDTPEPGPEPEAPTGTFAVVHKYYDSMDDLNGQRNEVRETAVPQTRGSAAEEYAASNPQTYQDYRLVRVERSDEKAIQLGADNQSTVVGNYVPKVDLVVTYLYVKPGTFNEVHLYFDSQEKAESGVATTAESREDNPRTKTSQTGLAEDSFTSEKHEKEGFTFLKAETDTPTSVQPKEDGGQVSGNFVPGATITHTYYYYRTTEPTGPEEPEVKTGTFTVIHRYFDTVESLEKATDPVKEETVPKTEGTDKDQFAGSSPKANDEYGFVKVVRSHPDSIPTGADNRSTVPGNYVPNTDLVVTYYYLKLGRFTEVHQYFDSEDEYRAGNQPTDVVKNPRTGNTDQQGLNTDSYTSVKNDRDGYVLYATQSDHADRAVDPQGKQVEGAFVPGETIVHTYIYVKKEPETPTPGGEDPDKPGGEDPDKPGGEAPDKPGGEDPVKPGGEDPDKPGRHRVGGTLPQTGYSGPVTGIAVCAVLGALALYLRRREMTR